MQQHPKRVLFVHNAPWTFVRMDRDILAGLCEVTELYLGNYRSVRPWKLRRMVRQHDLVFCWFASWHSFFPVLWAKALGVPSVVVIGGYDTANVPAIGYGSQRGGLRRLLSRTVMLLARVLIVNSHSAWREAMDNCGVKREKLVMIYHGVPQASERPRRERRLVLTVGNVTPNNLLRKGMLPFVRAARLLPDLTFALAGELSGDAGRLLAPELAANVQLLGRVSDERLEELYASASVYVQASLHEGFGLSLAEAMLAGSVPVVTRVGALPEVVGDAGVIVDSQSAEAIAAGIREALALGAKAGELAAERIRTKFTIARRSEELGALLATLGVGAPAMVER